MNTKPLIATQQRFMVNGQQREKCPKCKSHLSGRHGFITLWGDLAVYGWCVKCRWYIEMRKIASDSF